MSVDPTGEMPEGNDVPGAQALLRGLDVLLAIGTAPRPPRFRDLEKAVSIPRASLHRLLAALSSRRLIRYDERSKTYQVGMRVLELSRRSLDEIFPKPDYQIMHTLLFPHDIVHIENLGGEIDQVLDQKITFGCFPWRFQGGEAAFCRAVAFLDA